MSLTVIESPIPSLPRINERAPEFEAISTQGSVKLADYQGRWLLFFSHPSDFTPVCTSEFVTLAERYSDFQALNCDLLGLSIDSKYAHIAWVENIREKFGVDIPFPIIEDISMSVASTYGMVHPRSSNVATVRAVFIIDPKGILKATLYYPTNVGRSVDELLRLLKAIQTAEDYGVSTPEGWRPGDKIIVSPPTTIDELHARNLEGLDCKDWYFCQKKLEKGHAKRTA